MLGERVEGKTKIITPIQTVRVHSKDDLTAGDGAKHDVLPGKGALANRTTCNVFELLRQFNIPIAYYAKESDTSFLAPPCYMLPWEVVVRGEAHGSYLKRHPEIAAGSTFPQNALLCELFLKTSGRSWTDYEYTRHDLNCDDPLVLFDERFRARIFEPGKPIENAEPFLILPPGRIFKDEMQMAQVRGIMPGIACDVFDILRIAWKRRGYKLVDMKVEFGIGPDGRLLLADVIDNDSWRLLKDGANMDKQVYRDGGELKAVHEKYARIADATDWFKTDYAFVRSVRDQKDHDIIPILP